MLLEHPRFGGLGTFAAMIAEARRRLGARRQRRETEAIMRESEERFALFMRHLPGLAWIKDLEGRYVFANDAAQKAFRKSAAELYGRSDEEVFPVACAAQFKANDLRALAGEGIETLETLQHDDGIDHVSLVRKFPVFGPDGRPVLVGGIAIDVTDRLRAEGELKASEARKAAMLDTALDCVITIDHRGRIVDFNPAAERTFGYRRDDAVGLEMCELIVPPSRRDAHRQGMARYLATGESRILNRRVQMTAMRADGTEFPAELSITPITLDGPAMFTGYLRDITEQKRAERALQDSEAHFRTMADNAPAMLWVADAAGQCVYVSQQWCEYTGNAAEQGHGFGWADNVHPDDRQAARATALEAKKRRLPFSADYRMRTRNGDYRWVVDAGLPRFDAQGEFQGYIGCVIDVHDRKNYEHALKEADRRKDEFLATLAHELRNPLAPLRNAVQLFRLKGPPEPELQWARDVIDRQVEHLARLIDDLLDVSRITHDNLELRRERVALAEVVQGAVEMSRPLIEQRGHQLTVELPPEPVYVHADLIRMAQVFMNLLSNAAKYMERGGHIRLTAEREGDEIVIRVQDTGVGIAPEALSRVFDLFYQADSSLERSQSGLGIGLSLARRLIELHGGSITARSDGIGRGSEFVLRLAVAAGRAEDAQGESAVYGYTGASMARRILVVDDNRDSADSLAALLRLAGNEVHTAYDSLEALQCAEQFRPDVALLDIGMPKLNGCEAARRLRLQPWGQNMLLIAVTGWGQEEDRRRTSAAGFNAHLVKPVDHATLMRLLEEPLSATGAVAN
ncbi:MAG: PAS domain S-box protein [Gammaproteobacteria bacterium]